MTMLPNAISPEGPEAPAKPYSDVRFRMRDDLIAKVTKRAQHAGMTRSEYIARLVERAEAT